MHAEQSSGEATPRFTVIGTTTVDVFLTGFDRIPGFGVDEFTTEALTFLDDPVAPVLGGNGANSAYVLGALETEVGLCSFVGSDPLGSAVLGWLEGKGVDCSGVVRRPDWATAVTVVATDRSLRRASFHHPGGSNEFGPDDVPASALEQADFVLLSSYHLTPRLRGTAARDVLATARDSGAFTAIDLGPAIAPVARTTELQLVLPEADLLLCNEYEALTCSGTTSLESAVASLQDAGSRIVVIKRGADGASWYEADQRRDAPSTRVEASSTVGAGDSFNAGLLFALSRGLGPAEAMTFANATAAAVVSSPEGVMAAPTAAEVRARLTSRP